MTLLVTAQPTRHKDPTAKASKLAYLSFERPDLDRAEAFSNDFGLRTATESSDTLYLRHTGASPFCCVVKRAIRPRFVGLAFKVAHEADLDHLRRLPGASDIETMRTPGGGRRVRLRDPSGFAVDAVWGQGVQCLHPF